MATTGICVGGSSSSLSSSMAQSLLGYGGLRKVLPSDPSCKLTSRVFFFLLPCRRLQYAHRIIRTDQTLLPPMCGHDELDIVSVKELSDGFLHLSFGIPSNGGASSKVDGLSSSGSEHLAGTMAAPPRRLPSNFSKKSPIPKAVHQRKRQGNDLKVEASPLHGSIKEAGKLMSTRPKSCFVKRSPIPARKSAESLLNVSMPDVEGKIKKAQKEGHVSKRPRSKFVRRSLVPSSISRHHMKTILPSADETFLSEKPHEMPVKAPGTCSVTRPTSIFFRKSPIVRAKKLRSHVISLREANAPPPSKTSDNSTTLAKSPLASEAMVVDLERCKLAELKSLAKSKGLKGYSKIKKGELLDLLKGT